MDLFVLGRQRLDVLSMLDFVSLGLRSPLPLDTHYCFSCNRDSSSCSPSPLSPFPAISHWDKLEREGRAGGKQNKTYIFYFPNWKDFKLKISQIPIPPLYGKQNSKF